VAFSKQLTSAVQVSEFLSQYFIYICFIPVAIFVVVVVSFVYCSVYRLSRKFAKKTISFVSLSARMEQLGYHWTDFA
jgi:heme/copper-type cytochrome/quinol oxidase subunit 2